jgi:hypothetical protein
MPHAGQRLARARLRTRRCRAAIAGTAAQSFSGMMAAMIPAVQAAAARDQRVLGCRLDKV